MLCLRVLTVLLKFQETSLLILSSLVAHILHKQMFTELTLHSKQILSHCSGSLFTSLFPCAFPVSCCVGICISLEQLSLLINWLSNSVNY